MNAKAHRMRNQKPAAAQRHKRSGRVVPCWAREGPFPGTVGATLDRATPVLNASGLHFHRHSARQKTKLFKLEPKVVESPELQSTSSQIYTTSILDKQKSTLPLDPSSPIWVGVSLNFVWKIAPICESEKTHYRLT